MQSHIRVERRGQDRSSATEQDRSTRGEKYQQRANRAENYGEQEQQDKYRESMKEKVSNADSELDEIDEVLANNAVYLPLGNVALSTA